MHKCLSYGTLNQSWSCLGASAAGGEATVEPADGVFSVASRLASIDVIACSISYLAMPPCCSKSWNVLKKWPSIREHSTSVLEGFLRNWYVLACGLSVFLRACLGDAELQVVYLTLFNPSNLLSHAVSYTYSRSWNRINTFLARFIDLRQLSLIS